MIKPANVMESIRFTCVFSSFVRMEDMLFGTVERVVVVFRFQLKELKACFLPNLAKQTNKIDKIDT